MPLFEHWLHLHPWDLERLTRAEVAQRLHWVQERAKAIGQLGEMEGEDV